MNISHYPILIAQAFPRDPPDLSTIHSWSLTIVRRLLLERIAPADVSANSVDKYYQRTVPTNFVAPRTEHIRTNLLDVTLQTAA